jgi:hypothetical protein
LRADPGECGTRAPCTPRIPARVLQRRSIVSPPRGLTATRHAGNPAICPAPEAAHALTASLPLLQRATQVHLVCATERRSENDAALRQAEHCLALHRIEVRGRHRNLPHGDSGEG